MEKNPIIIDDVIGLSLPLKDYLEKGWTSNRKLSWQYRLIQDKKDKMVLIDENSKPLAMSENSIDFNNIPDEIILKREWVKEG